MPCAAPYDSFDSQGLTVERARGTYSATTSTTAGVDRLLTAHDIVVHGAALLPSLPLSLLFLCLSCSPSSSSFSSPSPSSCSLLLSGGHVVSDDGYVSDLVGRASSIASVKSGSNGDRFDPNT